MGNSNILYQHLQQLDLVVNPNIYLHKYPHPPEYFYSIQGRKTSPWPFGQLAQKMKSLSNALSKVSMLVDTLSMLVDTRKHGSISSSFSFRSMLRLTCQLLVHTTKPYIPQDGVQPKMSPTISCSGMYRKSFIYHMNRTNSQ